jgi:hypothetical protein
MMSSVYAFTRDESGVGQSPVHSVPYGAFIQLAL